MWRRYGKRQQQRKEERAREFEAVFSDPDLDLEEVAAQVGPYALKEASRNLMLTCVSSCQLWQMAPTCWFPAELASSSAAVMCRT